MKVRKKGRVTHITADLNNTEDMWAVLFAMATGVAPKRKRKAKKKPGTGGGSK